MASEDNLLTTAEVAKRLKCSIPTVRQYIHDQKFKQVFFIGKQFLIPKKSYEDFLENHDATNSDMEIA